VLAAANQKLYVVDANDAWPVLADAQLTTYVTLTVSPNGKLVAMFTADGKISVVSSDFQVFPPSPLSSRDTNLSSSAEPEHSPYALGAQRWSGYMRARACPTPQLT